MNTIYRSRAVRSPYQPYRPQEKKITHRDPQNGILETLKQLCRTQYALHASFAPDELLMSQVKTEGLVGVRCELRLGNRLIGIGYASSVLDPRFNRSITRSLYGCLNGSLSSAIHSGSKTLDVLRAEAADEEAASERGITIDAYRQRESETANAPTEKQLAFAKQIIALNIDESEQENMLASLESMTRSEISSLIQRLQS